MPLDIDYYLCVAKAARMRAFASGNAFVREEQDLFEARALQAEAARLAADRAVLHAEEVLEIANDADEAAELEADRANASGNSEAVDRAEQARTITTAAVTKAENDLIEARQSAAAAKDAEDFAEAEARQAAEAAEIAWQDGK